MFDKRPNNPTSVFTPSVFAIGSISSSTCKNKLPSREHHFEGKAPPLFILSFLWSITSDSTWQAIGTPKSSSLAAGWQEFHLHTTGFETLLGSSIFSENPLGLLLERPCKNYPGFYFYLFFLPSLRELAKVSKNWEKKFQLVFKVPILMLL